MDKHSKDQQSLPTQEKFFSTEKLRRFARAGTHLPDPKGALFVKNDSLAQLEHSAFRKNKVGSLEDL